MDINKEEMKELLGELLKENLKIHIDSNYKSGAKYLTVTATFNGEEICCDDYSLETYDDYGY